MSDETKEVPVDMDSRVRIVEIGFNRIPELLFKGIPEILAAQNLPDDAVCESVFAFAVRSIEFSPVEEGTLIPTIVRVL